MKSFNNQGVILNRLKAAYENRTENPCAILNNPGICNGIINLFHRKAMKHMKQNNSLFTLEMALKARDDMIRIYENIDNCRDSNIQKRINQLCFFQSPRTAQPQDSFCTNNAYLTNDDIEHLNHNYNTAKYVAEQFKTPKPKGPDILPYLKFYDGATVTQQFSGCVTKDHLVKVLSYYLPRHENQLIRIATPLHVVGIGFHKDRENNIFITLFDPNYDIKEPMQIIEANNLEEGITKLVSELGSSFYDIYDGYFNSFANSNRNLTLSIKFYSPPAGIENDLAVNKTIIGNEEPEVSGTDFLVSLLNNKDSFFDDEIQPDAHDANGYDSLFVSAQTGHTNTVAYLLNQYPHIMKPNAIQGDERKSTPVTVSKQQGRHDVSDLFYLHELKSQNKGIANGI